MQYYMANKYDLYDPVRKNMFCAVGSFVWDDLMKQPNMTETQRLLMNEAREAKMLDGVGVPLRGPRGALAGVGAASSSGGIELSDKNLLARINLISQQFYTVFLSLESSRAEKEPGFIFLTDREAEILKWSANGKTRGEISDILSISVNTIDFHLKNALRKLDASNVTLGVLKALHRGLIQM